MTVTLRRARLRQLARLVVAGAAGGAGARAGLRAGMCTLGHLSVGAQARLARTNYAGRAVPLVGGPVLVLAAALSAALPAGPARQTGRGSPPDRSALLLGLVAGAVGSYDDVAGARPEQRADKGVRGHLAALRAGRVSAGAVKAVGLGLAGYAAAGSLAPAPAPASAPSGPARLRAADRLLAAGIIAGTANLINLLDLRPGRALKVALLIGVPLLPGPAGAVLAGPLGAGAALLPADLAEQTMLGDTGANAIGALVGLGLAASAGRPGRVAALAALVALTAASERVSFSVVIERTPWLRAMDRLGRRAPPARR